LGDIASDPVSDLLKRTIKELGSISFDTFMDIALYSKYGYYNTQEPFGKFGDYYTSPTLHPAFSSFVALQIHFMWEILGRPNPFTVIEIGSGCGVMARDIISSLTLSKTKCIDSLRYLAFDRISQANTPDEIQTVISETVSGTLATGVVISNELIDALPTKMVEIHKNEIQEICVGLDSENKIIEIIDKDRSESPELRDIVGDTSKIEGYRGPVRCGIERWMSNISNVLSKGFLITIDYGFENSIYYSMNKSHRLLQTYYKHIETSNPYQRVGLQDITAHVDFTHFSDCAQDVGFRSLAFISQRDWLNHLHFEDFINRDLRDGKVSLRELNFIRMLTDPEGLGGFKVDVQELNTGIQSYDELIPDSLVSRNIWKLPRISNLHMAGQLFQD